jgi:uncharacterized membrane protein
MTKYLFIYFFNLFLKNFKCGAKGVIKKLFYLLVISIFIMNFLYIKITQRLGKYGKYSKRIYK